MHKEETPKGLGSISNETYNDLVAMCYGQIKEKIPAIRKVLDQRDYKSFLEIAHFLKSACLNLRLNAISDIVSNMEDMARQSRGAEEIILELDKLLSVISASGKDLQR